MHAYQAQPNDKISLPLDKPVAWCAQLTETSAAPKRVMAKTFYEAREKLEILNGLIRGEYFKIKRVAMLETMLENKFM
jgi:hypothetical protein